MHVCVCVVDVRTHVEILNMMIEGMHASVEFVFNFKCIYDSYVDSYIIIL